jgi:hypothetical protein
VGPWLSGIAVLVFVTKGLYKLKGHTAGKICGFSGWVKVIGRFD